MVGDNYTFIPARAGEAQDTLADANKAKELLGWEAKIKVEDWIKAAT